MCCENSEKVKVFVSLPMYGKTKEEVHNIFEWVESLLKKQNPYMEYEILDTWFEEDPPEDIEPRVYYLIKSLKLLNKADIAVFVPGCFERDSCIIEYWTCSTLNIAAFPIKTNNDGDSYIPSCPPISMTLEYSDDYHRTHQNHYKEIDDLNNDVIRTLLDRF